MDMVTYKILHKGFCSLVQQQVKIVTWLSLYRQSILNVFHPEVQLSVT